VLGAKVRALAEGRFNVSVEDLKALAAPALRHRVILNFEGEAEGIDIDTLVGQIVESAEAVSRQGKEPFSADGRNEWRILTRSIVWFARSPRRCAGAVPSTMACGVCSGARWRRSARCCSVSCSDRGRSRSRSCCWPPAPSRASSSAC
jgi:hypothetical protein